MATEQQQETREQRFIKQPVRAEDPSLSEESNRLLTREAQAIIGRTEVEVPEGTPERRGEAHARHSLITATLVNNRLILIIALMMGVVVLAITALATEQWWALALAGVVHAVATILVIYGILQLTTEVEHPDPSLSARLESEGVVDPDQMLSELVEDFAGTQTAHGAPEIVSGGFNEQTRPHWEDPAGATVEQRTSMTPSSEPGAPAGTGSPVAALPWITTGAMMIISLAFAIGTGGKMWLLPLITLPLGAAWIVLDRAIPGPQEEQAAARGERFEPEAAQRPTGDTTIALFRRLVPVMLALAVAVGLYIALVAVLVGGEL